jgi:periplasmic copper chaperone A
MPAVLVRYRHLLLQPLKNRDIIMFHSSSLRRRRLARVGAGVGAALAAILMLPGVAQAHVTVQPGSAEGGGFSVVALRVPNERDDASTTQLRVTLPKDQPLGSVQTTPMPGWKITTGTRHLDKPIEMFGERLDTVVSEVTWTATDGGIRPGQFQDFNLSLGQLPKSGELVFNVLQSYSGGEKVNWNEISADPSVEPEHPAPILSITPAAAETGSGASEPGSQAGRNEQVTATDQSGNASDSMLPLALSGVALVLSLVAIVVAWRRRPLPPAAPAASETSREDVNV